MSRKRQSASASPAASCSSDTLHAPFEKMSAQQVLSAVCTVCSDLTRNALRFGPGRSNDHSRAVAKVVSRDLAPLCSSSATDDLPQRAFKVYGILRHICQEFANDNVAFDHRHGNHNARTRAYAALKQGKQRLHALGLSVAPRKEVVVSRGTMEDAPTRSSAAVSA